ncbi:MAG: tetratricopeptide repeat protein [Minicystis sp.]
MRGALPTCLLLLAFTSGCWASAPAAPEDAKPAPNEPAPGAVPPWVPPLTPQQRALLKPLSRPIQVRAERVFPDLARFGYAPSRPLASAEDAVKWTRMVAQVLHDSPRFYTLDEAPAEAANVVAQYGPNAGEPDGYVIVKLGKGDLAELVAAPEAEEARAAVASGDKLAEGGDFAGAIAAYRAGLVKSPGVPALRVALADALRKAGKTAEAEAAYKEAIGVDPSFAPAQLGLAEIAEQRNDLPAARRALIEALAYHPASKRGLELAKKLGAGGFGGRPGPADGGWTDAPAPAARGAGRVQPFAILLDVDDVGAVHVGTAKSDPAQIYGGCRAVMRHEPDVRAQLFQQPREVPYYLSVAEEVVCLEASLGAYLVGRQGGDGPSPDLDELHRIAGEEGLSGYVMFEILGQHRPERARAAPPTVHRDVARYVEKHVLARRQALPEGKYTAAR